MRYLPWEILVVLMFLGLLIGIYVLLARYNAKTRARTRQLLESKGLYQKEVSCSEALTLFVKRAFDFKHRASLSELWWCVLCIVVPLNILSKLTPDLHTLLWIITFIPFMALFVRRFKDVNLPPVLAIFIYLARPIIEMIGNANFDGAWVLIFVPVGLACMAISVWALFRASDPYKNKYGDVPNLKKASATSELSKVRSIKVLSQNIMRKMYFNTIQSKGNLRLLIVISGLCAGISILSLLVNPPYSVFDVLWVVFWFYLPFLIVAPIKFICDGYAQDKRNKK